MSQRCSRVFEPGQGPQEKQVCYTDFCRLQSYFGKISKRDTLISSRYRPIRQHIVNILLRRPVAGAELTILLAASAASDENFEPKWSILDRFASIVDASCLYSGGPSAESQERSKFTRQTLVSAPGSVCCPNSRSAAPLMPKIYMSYRSR